LNNTVTAADGTITGSPFGATSDWYRYFLNQDPNWTGTPAIVPAR
jgi:hypothetical protein